MLIDTHCHLNLMVKESFDTPLSQDDCQLAEKIIKEAQTNAITTIINVGTSLVESINSILFARTYPRVYASVGIHPNDATDTWRDDLATLLPYVRSAHHHKIVAIGECGIDRHYPDYQLQRQRDVFKAQIHLALEHDLALIVHTRDAEEETLRCLEEFAHDPLRGVIHCFSGGLDFAQEILKKHFFLGIGGTITYPKNTLLREAVISIGYRHCILETDAPYLPPQHMRGKKNSPAQILTIAQYLAQLVQVPYEEIALETTGNARDLFRLDLYGVEV